MSNNISPVSFCGVRFEGPLSVKNLKRAGDFLSQAENIHFIDHVEQTFETDIVLKGDMSEMGFYHHKYGKLYGKYGCPSYSTENFFKDVLEIFSNIKKSVSLAKKDVSKSANEYERVRRGC